MTSIETDVLVVGSGPAGSMAAKYAAEKGVKVTLIEMRDEVGTPVRCGELMPSVAEIKDMFPNLSDTDTLFDVPSSLKCREPASLVFPSWPTQAGARTGWRRTDHDRDGDVRCPGVSHRASLVSRFFLL